jgi:hypothetical protein
MGGRKGRRPCCGTGQEPLRHRRGAHHPTRAVLPSPTCNPPKRLRDDARKDKDVIAYLSAENEYTEAVMADTKLLQVGLCGGTGAWGGGWAGAAVGAGCAILGSVGPPGGQPFPAPPCSFHNAPAPPPTTLYRRTSCTRRCAGASRRRTAACPRGGGRRGALAGPAQGRRHSPWVGRAILQHTRCPRPHPHPDPHDRRYKGFWYYSRTGEGQQYKVHCRRAVPPGARPQDEADAPPEGDDAPAEEVLLDENKRKEEGKHEFYMVSGWGSDGAVMAWA